MTVLCPSCAGDWPLDPPAGVLALTLVDCECGASFEVDPQGQVRLVAAGPRLSTDPRRQPPPRRIDAIVREILP